VQHVKGKMDLLMSLRACYFLMSKNKLLMKGCEIFLARLIFCFLKNRSFQVCVDKAQSSSCDIPYGVPQGAIISPTLFNIFTSDAPKGGECELATFTDDTAIFVPAVVCNKRINFASHTAKSTDGAKKAFRILYSFLSKRSKYG
jgi:hypothetical protein